MSGGTVAVNAQPVSYVSTDLNNFRKRWLDPSPFQFMSIVLKIRVGA
jgi:hypothetical protein